MGTKKQIKSKTPQGKGPNKQIVKAPLSEPAPKKGKPLKNANGDMTALKTKLFKAGFKGGSEESDSDSGDDEPVVAKKPKVQSATPNKKGATPAGQKRKAEPVKSPSPQKQQKVEPQGNQQEKTPKAGNKRKADTGKGNNVAENTPKQKKNDSENFQPQGSIKESEARTLFLKNFPLKTTTDDVKALSPDIVQVRMRSGPKTRFAYVEFKTEEQAVKNYELFKTIKLHGRNFFIDFCGKRSGRNAPQEPTNVDPLRLFVRLHKVSRDSVEDAKNELEKALPEATQITAPVSRKGKPFGYIFVTFKQEKQTKAALEKLKDSDTYSVNYGKMMNSSEKKNPTIVIDPRCLYVRSIDKTNPEASLKKHFPEALYFTIPRKNRDENNSELLGYAIVAFETAEQCTNAVQSKAGQFDIVRHLQARQNQFLDPSVLFLENLEEGTTEDSLRQKFTGVQTVSMAKKKRGAFLYFPSVALSKKAYNKFKTQHPSLKYALVDKTMDIKKAKQEKQKEKKAEKKKQKQAEKAKKVTEEKVTVEKDEDEEEEDSDEEEEEVVVQKGKKADSQNAAKAKQAEKTKQVKGKPVKMEVDEEDDDDDDDEEDESDDDDEEESDDDDDESEEEVTIQKGKKVDSKKTAKVKQNVKIDDFDDDDDDDEDSDEEDDDDDDEDDSDEDESTKVVQKQAVEDSDDDDEDDDDDDDDDDDEDDDDDDEEDSDDE